MGTIPSSLADASGLQRVDMVLSIKGLVLEVPSSLQHLVNSKAPGDVLEVAYLRDARLASR
jgi:S1-C subfamily serine protease